MIIHRSNNRMIFDEKLIHISDELCGTMFNDPQGILGRIGGVLFRKERDEQVPGGIRLIAVGDFFYENPITSDIPSSYRFWTAQKG